MWLFDEKSRWHLWCISLFRTKPVLMSWNTDGHAVSKVKIETEGIPEYGGIAAAEAAAASGTLIV
jgi:hypothetical protein